MKLHKGVWLEIGIVAAVVGAALFVRVFLLDRFPPGLYNDEAAYGMDGLAVLHGDLRIFYARNNGREPLFIYLLAAVFQFLGATPYTIRLTAALTGAATIATTYWMVRSLFRFAPEDNERSSRWYALWVTLFLAFSYWHISLSRVGFRAITLPLLLTVATALFWIVCRRLRQPGGTPWILTLAGGATLGATLYTYTASRMSLLLFGGTIGLLMILAPRFGIERSRLFKTAGVALLAALLTAAPLLAYFVMHPAYFGAHAAEVSIFNPQYAGDDPISALMKSAIGTFLVFFTAHDGNLRHNPAQIPLLDPLLAGWLVAGLVLAAFYWRRVTTAFMWLWFLLFAAPAIFSSEGVPHSLRMIGMAPIVYVLPVMAMGWVSARFPARAARLARWLPLPFLLLAAFVSLSSYFNAWTPSEGLRKMFMVDYADFGSSIAATDTAQTLWTLPLGSREMLADGQFNTIDFLQRDPGAYATIVVDEATAPDELAAHTEGRRFVNVLRPAEIPELYDSAWIFSDVTGLLNMLLRRNSIGAPGEGREASGLPFASYELGESRTFALPPTERTVTGVTFGDTFQLTGFNLGAGNRWESETGALTAPADAPLWIVLRWQATQPVTTIHKSSLVLRDADGNLAGQVDDILVSDRYPNMLASTYHILDPLPGISPGAYTLELRVYEDASGRVLPVRTASDAAAVAYPLAEVTVTPPQEPGVSIPPTYGLENGSILPDFEVIGYDLPGQTLSPGDRLPLTLYLRAPVTPTTDYSVAVELLGADGASAAQVTLTPGAPGFPPSQWRAGEFMRTMAMLQTTPTLAHGLYTLHVSIRDGAQVLANFDLPDVEVSGRAHILATPAVALPFVVTFGDVVRLVGVDAPQQIEVQPGATLNLTAIWQPLNSEQRSLIRFMQLLNEAGQLVVQQDTAPCEAACPSTSWIAAEYLEDTARLTLPADLPAGSYHIITGWYDAATQQRLPAFAPDGEALPNDAARLPLEVIVNG